MPSSAPGTALGRFGRWILVALILLACAKTAWSLGGKSLWWDESLSLQRAQETLPRVLSNAIILTDTVHQLYTIDPHPPLYFLALWLALRLLGTTEFALRILSLACVVAIVPLLYATGCRLVGRRVGLAAAALGALSPMYLWYGQESRMYAMLAVLSLLSFYCFVRAFFDPPTRQNPRQRRVWIVAYIVASASVMVTHYSGALLIVFELLGLGIVFLRQPRARRSLRPTITVLSVLLMLAALYVWYYTHLTALASIRAEFVPLGVIARDLLNSFSLGLSVDIADWYVRVADLAFLAALILGLVLLLLQGTAGRQRTAGWLLTGYLLVPLLLLFLLSYAKPAYMNSRHLILISPAFYLLVAAGLTQGREPDWGFVRWGKIPVLAVGWLLVIGGTIYSTYNCLANPNYDKDHNREWGAYLREHVRPGDFVVLSSPYSAELYKYYADSGTPWIGLPLLDTPQQETIATLESLLQQYDRVWLAVSDNTINGVHHKLIEQWLNEHAFRVDYQVFRGVSSAVQVACYLPTWPSVDRVPEDAESVEAPYSSALRLSGYRLASSSVPGRLLHIQLFWGVDQIGLEQKSILLRLVDKEGHEWGRSQQCPFNGLYPMWQWQAGLLLRDEHDLLISPGTPPGTYELEVVLFEQPGGCADTAGLPMYPLSAANRRGEGILLGEVQVGRPDAPPSLEQLDIKHRQHVRFDGLELLGQRTASAELKPGGPLDVVLSWQAQHGSLTDQRFRLRLVDSEGRVWHEALIRPAGDSYPTDHWQAGDRFQGQFRLWLPETAPAGRYRLELVPELPSLSRGVIATVRRWLNPAAGGVRLASLDVAPRPAAADATPPPLPTGLTIAVPMLATLGDEVRFLGYELSADAVRAGEPLSVTLYWQALRPMDVNYTVFLHLLDPTNEIVGQKDSMPADGGLPTAAWQLGEVITDARTFLVDPAARPGSHVLEMGLYRLETLERLPVRDTASQAVTGDRILLSQITVLPALEPTAIPPRFPFRIYLPIVAQQR